MPGFYETEAGLLTFGVGAFQFDYDGSFGLGLNIHGSFAHLISSIDAGVPTKAEFADVVDELLNGI